MSKHNDLTGFHTEVGEPRDFPPLDKVSPPDNSPTYDVIS